jgi:hypothetical protein
MRRSLDEEAPALCNMLILVIAIGKRFQLCYANEGSIGDRLKSVHLNLLGISWWMDIQARGTPLLHEATATLLVMFFDWLATFPFEERVIWPLHARNMFEVRPKFGDSDAVPMVMMCPVRHTNLAGRVTTGSLARFRETVNSIRTQIRGRYFWQNKYNKMPQVMGMAFPQPHRPGLVSLSCKTDFLAERKKEVSTRGRLNATSSHTWSKLLSSHTWSIHWSYSSLSESSPCLFASNAEMGPHWHFDGCRQWSWLHDGVKTNGWVEFGAEGVLRTSLYTGRGSW